LLGNHIDYNGGPVLAAAIDRAAVALVKASSGDLVSFVFPDVDGGVQAVTTSALGDWRATGGHPDPLDYARGVIAAGLSAGTPIRNGAQVAIAGDVPLGFGISSSAALCVVLGLALFEPAPRGRTLVLRAQEGEVRAGTPCGTMDQSASVGGNVILYDGATTTWESITPDLDGYAFAVCDSGVSRHLASSSYPVRVKESHRALALINEQLGSAYGNLAEIPSDCLASTTLPAPLDRRVRHVISETARVQAGAAAMRAGDWVRFGALMSESGTSSAMDYEISHPRVEEMVAIAKAVDGVVGARMMGGGEGGAALVLLSTHAVPDLRLALRHGYYGRHGSATPEPVQVFGFADGAGYLPI
jgi:galactokinase